MSEQLPYDSLRGDTPGVGGVLKDEPADFEVEEIPAYAPIGDGEHLFLWIEKRDTSHEQLTWHIARSLGIPASEIGIAGIKDRRAITRQYVSVPARCADRIPGLDTERIRVLHAVRHRNKLKRGHLRGNRFVILLRGVAPEKAAVAEAAAERIRVHGFPNYFGQQRFGTDDSTLSLGYDLLRGTQRPRDIPPSRRRFLLSLALSAVQSDLFNEALAQRIRDGLLRIVLPGDVMLVVASGGRFVVEDPQREQARFQAGETVISGPLFGPDMLQPQGEPAEREARVLQARGLDRTAFEQFAKLTSGTRRALLVGPDELSITLQPDGLHVCCVLSSGVYATSLLREVQ